MPDSVSGLYDSFHQPQYCVGGVHTIQGASKPWGPEELQAPQESPHDTLKAH